MSLQFNNKKIILILLVLSLLQPSGLFWAAEQNKAAFLLQTQSNPSLTTELAKIRATPLKALNTQERPVTLISILQATSEASPELRLEEARLEEVRIKKRSLLSRRLLFFFKYLNTQYLEGSANNDISASEARLVRAKSTVLLEAAKTYYQLLKTYLARQVAYQTLQQGLSQLDIQQDRFLSAEGTSFTVQQAQAQTLSRYQAFLEADAIYQNVSETLNILLLSNQDATEKINWIPAGLEKNTTPLQSSSLQLKAVNYWLTIPTDAEVRAMASNARAELQELKHQRESMQNLIKASAYELDKTQTELLQSTLNQLLISELISRRQVEDAAAQALRTWKLSREKIILAQKQWQLAQQSLKQTQVSYEAGFTSYKELLEAEVLLAQAQIAAQNAMADEQFQQLILLYETGQLELASLSAVLK